MKARIRYIFFATLIAFIIWVIGELILMFKFPNSTLTAARIWALVVLISTCIWNVQHFRRQAKKEREDKENEEYKSVY